VSKCGLWRHPLEKNFLIVIKGTPNRSGNVVHIHLAALLPISKLTMMALLVAATGIYFFFEGVHLIVRTLALKRACRSLVRDASPGPVAISGMAIGPRTLKAPISGDPCFVYQTIVWEQSRPGRNQFWNKIADETLNLPFFVQDSTGQLLVEPFGAELDLRPEIEQEFGSGSAYQDGLPPRVSIFLSRHGVSPGRPIRIEERTLRPEAPVFIAGALVQNPGVRVPSSSQNAHEPAVAGEPEAAEARDGKTSDPAPVVIKLAGGEVPSSASEMNQQQKIAAALVRAGITKPEAWTAAGVPYESVAVQDPIASDSSDPGESANSVSTSGGEKSLRSTSETLSAAIPPLVLTKGDDAVFVISNHSQAELASVVTWKSIAMILGGAILALLGSYVLFFWHQVR
jgi:hypothetical protein